MTADEHAPDSRESLSDAPATEPVLSEIDARILGSLVEKEATTPDTYPLTSNAIVLACNQKTAREPTMQLEPGEVGNALRRLEVRGWVRSQHSGRTERYSHRVEKMLDLTKPQAALLALLMLRGPQTLHELLSRSERLASFASADDVQHALERLAQREPPLVRHLPRQGGQREDRYAHLLSGEPALPAFSPASPAAASSGLADRVASLEARIDSLEARLAALERTRRLATREPEWAR
ncbi:MAG: YceH family protein [Pseudomonadota bacterium]|nr:YceH family protein [Pseudomonadota bacterium]